MKNFKITAKVLTALYELDAEYNIRKYYEMAEGDSEQEKITNMALLMVNLPNEDKFKLIEYYSKYYSLAYNKPIAEVEEMDFKEVKQAVYNFRFSY